MSFLVNKLAEHAGDMVADKIKGALGVDDDKDKKKGKKDDNDGGFLSIFKHDKKKDDQKKKKEEDDDRGFFDKLFKKDQDDDREKISKRSGFSGLFSEQEGPEGGAATWPEGDCERCEDIGENTGEGDLDLMNDLIAVANDTS